MTIFVENPGVTLNVNDVAPYPQDFSTHHNYATSMPF
jgi:hypothetical protein